MNDYFCPKCNAPIKISNHIILKAIPKSSNTLGSMVLFEPILGDFRVTTHKTCTMKDGMHIEFYCPICNANLSAEDEYLTHINMTDSDGDNYEIWFSEITGEHATYKIKAGKIADKYGEHSSKYTNHWGSFPTY
jgi:hypothetical protein